LGNEYAVCESTTLWYLLYTKPRQESKAAQHLANQHVECFFPKLRVQKLIRGKRAIVQEPLFPNYLFAALDPQVHNFTAIRSTRGVCGFVRFGDAFTTIPQQLINELMQQEQNQGQPEDCAWLARAGDKVQIVEGPFAGLDAIYRCEDGLERSMLLIKLLHNECEVSIANLQFISRPSQ